MIVRRPIVYDITRLVTRGLNRSPNGIDRVDFALARHFLAKGRTDNLAMICTLLGPRLAPAALAAQTIAEIEECWAEYADPAQDKGLDGVVAAFAEPAPPTAAPTRWRLEGIARNWGAVRRWALYPGPSPAKVPQGSIFVNASTFLLDKPWLLSWLDNRPDVKPLFFVHDLLPIDYPEFFWAAEATKHPLRLQNAIRRGAGGIVGAAATARRLHAYAETQGRANLPICVARLPVSPVFATAARAEPRLSGANYFVVCGTIEPRKNHLLLLHVWRALAEQPGRKTPKLVIVGKRGWLNQNIVGLLERSATLRAHVIETSTLSTPAMRRLIAGARAMLMPSFAEGFGLPLAEAIAARVPIIASDIEVFREIGGDAPLYLDPLDGLGWLKAISDFADPNSSSRQAALARVEALETPAPEAFFDAVDNFADGL